MNDHINGSKPELLKDDEVECVSGGTSEPDTPLLSRAETPCEAPRHGRQCSLRCRYRVPVDDPVMGAYYRCGYGERE